MSRFEGDLWTMPHISEARGEFEAVGIWWARSLLLAHFDIDPNFLAGKNEHEVKKSMQQTLESFVRKRREIEQTVGGFSRAVASLAEDQEIKEIDVLLEAPSILLEAAVLSGMPANGRETFPYMSHSRITNSTVRAKLGHRGQEKQVWPVLAIA